MDPKVKSSYLTPFQRQVLEENLHPELPDSARQRLEIVLLTDRGKSQAEICRTLGCCASTASRWIHLTKSGLAHKYLECPVGRPKLVTDEYIELLRELLQHSPKDYGYPFNNWTVNWLSKHIAKEMGIEVSESHLKRVMGELGLSTRTAGRLRHQLKARSTKHAQTSPSIFITDLPGDRDLPDRQLSELNLFHVKHSSQIYGAASSFSAYFPPATQRNLRCFTQFLGVSILSQ
jgi:transposase